VVCKLSAYIIYHTPSFLTICHSTSDIPFNLVTMNRRRAPFQKRTSGSGKKRKEIGVEYEDVEVYEKRLKKTVMRSRPVLPKRSPKKNHPSTPSSSYAQSIHSRASSASAEPMSDVFIEDSVSMTGCYSEEDFSIDNASIGEKQRSSQGKVGV
jgi:hypothetical protein